MSARYGQPEITWSTVAAPQLFTGECTSYSYDDATTRQTENGASGQKLFVALHSSKAELNFEAKVTAGSTNFLQLSEAAGAIAVSGISAGVVLVRRAVERWRLLQPKIASIQATHYPDIVQAGPALAGVALSAVTPDQSALTILYPGSPIVYSTYGLGHASGQVQMLEITQELEITEDPPSPDGKILSATTHGYMRTVAVEILSKAAAPAKETVLVVTGAPTHAGNHVIENVTTRFESERGKLYAVRAVWIPAMG